MMTFVPNFSHAEVIDMEKQTVKLINGLDHSSTTLYVPKYLLEKNQDKDAINFNLTLPVYNMVMFDGQEHTQIKIKITQGSKIKYAQRTDNPLDIHNLWVKTDHESNISDTIMYQYLKFDWDNIPDLADVVYVPKDPKWINKFYMICTISGKRKLMDSLVNCYGDMVLPNALSISFSFPKTELINWKNFIFKITNIVTSMEHK